MSRANDGQRHPRAMIHKRILEAAAADTDCSFDDLAGEVPGATADLVRRVLEEYGDPATDEGTPDTDAGVPDAEAGNPEVGDEPPTTEDGDGETTATVADGGTQPDDTMSQNGHSAQSAQTAASTPGADGADDASETEAPVTDPGALTDAQRETLRAVHRAPTATQEAVAEDLGVTRATVSRRLNDIPGFAWESREAFATRLFGADRNDGAETGTTADTEASDEPDDGPSSPTTAPAGAGDIPPDLVHKVAHACMESDALSEDEELTVLAALMDR